MKMFNKALENLRFINDKHEAEWRRDQGEDVEIPQQPEPVPSFLPASEKQVGIDYGLDENRFLGEAKPRVESIRVLENSEHHSWLYNEVMKAINDAAAKNKNAKIIAIFVPVVQNSKELENLPVDEVVTISTDNASAEDLNIDTPESDSQAQEQLEKLEEEIDEITSEAEAEPDPLETVEFVEVQEPELAPMPLPLETVELVEAEPATHEMAVTENEDSSGDLFPASDEPEKIKEFFSLENTPEANSSENPEENNLPGDEIIFVDEPPESDFDLTLSSEDSDSNNLGDEIEISPDADEEESDDDKYEIRL